MYPEGLCKLRLTLGFVRKSAVSGNSTGDRVTEVNKEPVPAVSRLWLGEDTGLRLGDAPEEDERENEIQLES